MMMRKLVLLGLAGLLTLPVPALAQRGRNQMRARPDRPGPQATQPEAFLRLRERLQLSEDQVARLRALREETVRIRREEAGARMELGSRLRAGEITREEARKERAARRDAFRQRMGERSPASEILTAPQRETLRELQRERIQAERRMRARIERDRFQDRGIRGDRGRPIPGARPGAGRRGPPPPAGN